MENTLYGTREKERERAAGERIDKRVEYRPCLLTHDVPKSASSSRDPKLLAAEIQDNTLLTLYLLCFLYLSLDHY